MKPPRAPQEPSPPIAPRPSFWLWASSVMMAIWLAVLSWLAWRG